MAYLKSRKNKVGKTYYATQIHNPLWTKPYLTISLGTSDYKVAMQRHQEIEDKENAIKQGMSFTWSWKEERGRTRIKKQTIQMLIDEWLTIKSSNVRNSSILKSIREDKREKPQRSGI